MKYIKLGIIASLLLGFGSCSKESIKEFIVYTIPEYMRKALPKNTNTVLDYKFNMYQDGPVKFKTNGGYFNMPLFTMLDPVDYSESYYWNMVFYLTLNGSQQEFVKIRTDTINYNKSIVLFRVTSWDQPDDSIYYYIHKPLPKDSIYKSDIHKFYSTYTIDNKTYNNCFEIKGGPNNANKNKYKMIFNYTEGVIYFESSKGSNFTLNH